MRERYVNPYTDFGFKKLFGTELNKDLLKDAEKEGSDPLIPTGKDAQEKEKHPIDPAEQKKQESIAASWKKIRDEYGWGPKPGTLSMDE